jgi:hypothetical protein
VIARERKSKPFETRRNGGSGGMTRIAGERKPRNQVNDWKGINPYSTLPTAGRVKAGKRFSYFDCKGCWWMAAWPWAGVLKVKT